MHSFTFVFFSVNCLFVYFAIFFLLPFSYVCRSSIFVLDINPFVVVHIANISYKSVGSFHLLLGPLMCTDFNLNVINMSISSYKDL